MIKYNLLLSRENGYSRATIEKSKTGTFYKVEEVDKKIKKLEKCLFNITMFDPSCNEYKEGYKMLDELLPSRFENY